MTTAWLVSLPESLTPGALQAHRGALATLPERFRESTLTDRDAGPEQPSVGVVSLALPGWEQRLERLRGALVTDLALLNPADIERLAAVCEASRLPIVPDLPELHEPAGRQLATVLGEATAVRLVIGTGRSSGADVPSPVALRTLALAQITALGPLISRGEARIGPTRVGSDAFTCSLELGEVVVEMSAVLCRACPESTEIIVLGEGSLTRVVLQAGPTKWQSEMTEMTDGEELVMPARYSSGRREAWLRLYEALGEGGVDQTSSFLADLTRSVALLECLGLPW